MHPSRGLGGKSRDRKLKEEGPDQELCREARSTKSREENLNR